MTDKCTFCNEEEETIERLLTICKYIYFAGKKTLIKCLNMDNIHENLDELKYCFGVLNSNSFLAYVKRILLL